MKRTLRALCCIGVGLISATNVAAQGLDKAFEALGIYNYFEAKRLFEKNLPKFPAGSWHGLASIAARRDNPFYQLDSAVVWWRRSEAAFAAADPKARAFYDALGLSDSLRKPLADTLAAQVWLRTRIVGSRSAYDAFVRSFPQSGFAAAARTQLYALAYAEADTAAQPESALRAFAAAYPAAPQAALALARAERAFFVRESAPGSPEAYVAFAERHAGHSLAAEALDSVFVLTTRSSTTAAFRYFIQRFPKHPRIAEAWQRLYELATADALPQRYLLFAHEYPAYPQLRRLRQDLALAYARHYPIRQDSLWGYADSSWVVAIAPAYASVGFFSEGRAVVSDGKRFGYLNRRGELVIAMRFDEAEPFIGGVAVVTQADHMGLIDPQGRWLAPPVFASIGRFAEGMAPARKRGRDRRDTLVFLNRRGDVVIRPEYANAGAFSEGLAWARLPAAADLNGDSRPDTLPGADSVCYISPSGQRVIPARYTWADDFFAGVARVRVGALFGLIDPAGNYILLPEQRYIGRATQGLLRVAQGEKFGYVNLRGEWVVPLLYDFSEALASDEGTFGGGTAVIQKRVNAGGRWIYLQGLADTLGREVVPPRYEAIRPFVEALAPVAQTIGGQRRWGFINHALQQVTPYRYDFVAPHREGLARVRRNGKFGYVDSTGREVISAQFELADDFGSGFGVDRARVAIGGKVGLLNRSGHFILPADLDALTPLDGPLVQTVRKGRVGYYDLVQQLYRWTEPFYFE